MRPLSPSQKARLDRWFEGPSAGEDRNQWLSRMNRVLTESDRQWIVDFMDAHKVEFDAAEAKVLTAS